jgi:cytochrome c-type biogenesis protein CcmH
MIRGPSAFAGTGLPIPAFAGTGSLVRWALCCLALLMGLSAGPAARAFEPSERLADPVLERRAEVIDAELRCLVCQNESIEESDAGLAHDLRLLIRRRLVAGDTDRQVLDFVVARYGIFVLLDPPFEPVTYLLWLTPPLLLLAAGGLLAWRMRRPPAPEPPPLSAEERARAALFLGERG